MKLSSKGRGKEALEILDNLLSVSDHSDDKLQLNLLAIRAARESGQSEEAKRRLEAAESLASLVDKDEIQIALYIERLYYQLAQRDFFSAVVTAREAREKFGHLLKRSAYKSLEQEIATTSAIASACMGHCQVAIEPLKLAVKRSKRDSALWFYLGHCQLNLTQLKAAKESLVRAAKLGIGTELEQMLHFDSAVLFTKLGNLREARIHLDRAMDISSTDAKLAEFLRALDSKLRARNY